MEKEPLEVMFAKHWKFLIFLSVVFLLTGVIFGAFHPSEDYRNKIWEDGFKQGKKYGRIEKISTVYPSSGMKNLGKCGVGAPSKEEAERLAEELDCPVDYPVYYQESNPPLK